jgi:hypothetical protein
MKHRLTFFAGAAVGYVFGTKAGRERYEQLKRASRKFADNPKVQEAAGVLRSQAEELAVNAKDKAGEMAGVAKVKAGEVAEKLPGRGHEDQEGPGQPAGAGTVPGTGPLEP